MQPSIHQFTINNIEGEAVPLSNYKGKVLLIVNTASQCGFTPQLEDMEEIYRDFRAEGLEILAFPSNDFGGQEPLEGAEIQQFCLRKFEADFPIMEKSHVKGAKASELFQFLGDHKQNGAVNAKPNWNFHKYLVNKNGEVVNYFLPITKPNSNKVKKAIQKELNS